MSWAWGEMMHSMLDTPTSGLLAWSAHLQLNPSSCMHASCKGIAHVYEDSNRPVLMSSAQIEDIHSVLCSPVGPYAADAFTVVPAHPCIQVWRMAHCVLP